MSYRFKEARTLSGKSLNDAADALQVSSASIVNWEAGRRIPSVETIMKLADLYGVSVDYLLGRTGNEKPFCDISKKVSITMLPFLHEHPVFINNQRWGLVDAINERIRFVDGSELSLNDVLEIAILPPPFHSSDIPKGKRLSRDEIETVNRIWVEPLSKDEDLRQEMRGWYSVKDRFVENEFGIRFYLDTYENKWIAFKK